MSTAVDMGGSKENLRSPVPESDDLHGTKKNMWVLRNSFKFVSEFLQVNV
jgi:hypothetical protein